MRSGPKQQNDLCIGVSKLRNIPSSAIRTAILNHTKLLSKPTTVTAAIAILTSSSIVNAFTTVYDVKHTFYGCTSSLTYPPNLLLMTKIDPDNSPPGQAIAYDRGRGTSAGGQGIYDDPRTMATAPGTFDQCEVVSDPYTEKYLIFEDTCDECENDWDNGVYHIDFWTGNLTESGGEDQIECEDELTPVEGYDVVRYGSKDHEVNSKFSE